MKLRTTCLATVAATLLLPLSLPAAESAASESRKPAAGKPLQTESCPLRTGSRIPPRKENNCETSQRVRSWSKQDLESTGESNLADALRKLDPAFR